MPSTRTATAGDNARAALNSHDRLSIHAGAVDALARALDELAPTDTDPPTEAAFRDALDRLKPALEARGSAIKSLGGLLGSSHKAPDRARDYAATWLALASGEPAPVPTPAPINGAPADPPAEPIVRPSSPTTEGELGRIWWALGNLVAAVDALLAQADARARGELDALATARECIDKATRQRPFDRPF